MTDDAVAEVIIIGAGPAGCGAARLLSAWGHRVVIVDRPGGGSRALAESIPPSAKKALAALGMLTPIEDAGFQPWRGNTVWWTGESEDAPPRTESFPPGVAGYQVDRADFDRRLRALAVETGATIRQQPAGAPIVPGVTAPFVLDCSGRAGVIARQGLRRAEASHHTVALVGVWRAERPWPPPLADDTHTFVASHADGWAWSVSTRPLERHVTVMVDPRRTDLARGAPSRAVYEKELAKVRPFQSLLAHATLVDGPWGADASLYSAERYAGPGFLLVGDAGSFIDPLSSFGVKKALASAWLAAIAVHTAIARPAMRDEALAFFDRRERAVYASARRQAAQFAADAAARTNHPFWLTRASAPDGVDPDDGAEEVDAAALARDPSVIAAFEDLRQRPAVHFRTGSEARIGPRAAVRGREIVMDDHLFLPVWPAGVRYLRAVDVVALARLAPAHADVGDLVQAYTRAHGHVALPDLLGVIATLIAKGGLVTS